MGITDYDRDLENNPGKGNDCLESFSNVELNLVTGLRQRIDREISGELAKIPKDTTNIPPLPSLFEHSPLLAGALARAEAAQFRKPQDGLDDERYKLPPPNAGDEATLEAWQASLDNAFSQVGYQHLRLTNVDLLNRFGGNAWRLSNFLVEQSVERINKETEAVQAETEEINRTRKNDQVSRHWSIASA